VSVRRRVDLLVAVAVVGGLLAISGGLVGVAVATDTAPQCSTVSYTQNASEWNKVENVSQLQCIGTNESSLSEDYVLTGDIDASGTMSWNDGAGFEPIGASSASPNTAFTGTFDGDGHTITALTINRTTSSNPVGLFSGVKSTGTVSNLTLEESTISGNNTVGALVGNNKGMVRTVAVTGEVEGNQDGGAKVALLVGNNRGSGTIEASSVSGSINGSVRVGGLAGINRGTIQNSTARVEITADKQVGGIAGTTDGGAIRNSSVNGTITAIKNIGGVVGSATRVVSIENTRSDVDVTASGTFVGGLVGQILSGEGSVTSSHATGSVDGERSVGGLVGYSNAAVTASTASGAVSGSEYVGGLVGSTGQYSMINRSNATGTVSGENSVGGLVGRNRGAVNTSYATGGVTGGQYVGGLIGFVNGTVEDTYAAPTAAIRGDQHVGGLIGYIDDTGRSFATGLVNVTESESGGITSDSPGSVSDSYWNVETTNQSSSDGGTALTTAQMTGADALNSGNMDALSNSVWAANADTANERRYPTLRENSQSPPPSESLYAGGDGSVGSPYQIATWSQLDAIRLNPAANFTLTANLSASTPGYDGVANSSANGGNGFKPLSRSSQTEFVGAFEGQDRSIDDLTIDRPDEDQIGLFGYVGGSASIANVSLQNADITGGRVVGGLAGKNAGTITGSSVKGDITSTGIDTAGGLIGNNQGTVTGSMAIADVDGGMLVGGLVGTNGGTIIDSSAMGDTRGSNSNVGGLVGSNTGDINRSYATGSVSGAGHLGGLVGSNNDGATVTNTYTIGDVTGTEQSSYVGGLIGSNSGLVAESFATGEVDGDVIIGGLIGETDGSSLTGDNDGGTVTDSYWDRGTTNQSDAVGSGTGTNLTGFGTVGTDEPAGAMTGDDALADDNMDALSNSVWATVDESTTGSSGDGYPVLVGPTDPRSGA